MGEGDRSQGAPPELYRVAGEDTPVWLAGGFCVVGLVLALATSFLALSGPLGPLETPPEAALPRSVLPPEAAPQITEVPPAPQDSAPPANSSEEAPRGAEVECLPVVSIGFTYRSSRPLKEAARERLAPLLDRLKRDPDAKLLVEGHTDSKGGEAYNVMLSYARARSVIAWLETEGVERRQMTALAAGTSQPRDPAVVVAENRMALLRIEGVRPCPMEGAKSQ